MLKFVIPQPGSATITLHQTGDNNPLVFGTSVVADCVDLRKFPDAQNWCPAHRIVDGVGAPVIPDSHVGLYDEASLANAYIVPFDLWLSGRNHHIVRRVEGWKLAPCFEDKKPKRQVCLGLPDLIARNTLMHANQLVRETQLPEGCTVVRTTRTVPQYILDALRKAHNTNTLYTCYTTPYSPVQAELISVITDEKFNVVRYRARHRLNDMKHTTYAQPQWGVQTTAEYVYPVVTTINWAAGQPVRVTYRDLTEVVAMFEAQQSLCSALNVGAYPVDITDDLEEDAEGILFCTPHGMPHHEVEVVAARIMRAPKPEIPQQDPPDFGHASTLQRSVLDAPLNAKGAHDLSALQPGLEWYDLYTDDAPITDNMREQFAIEAGCNEEVLKWARVPVTDENVFAQYPPMAVFEFAASMICA